jgi:cell division protease FtsH
MGGIAAEVLELGESSTAAGDDLERATTTAREMVGTYGMSASLGRLRLLHHGGGYLGGESAQVDVVSDATLAGFDDEVRRLLAQAETQATQALRTNRDLFHALAARLEEAETLEGDELDGYLNQAHPAPTTANGAPTGSPWPPPTPARS